MPGAGGSNLDKLKGKRIMAWMCDKGVVNLSRKMTAPPYQDGRDKINSNLYDEVVR